MIYKILEVRNGVGKLNNIRKTQVLKIGHNQIGRMLEEKALIEKTNYNWQGLDVA